MGSVLSFFLTELAMQYVGGLYAASVRQHVHVGGLLHVPVLNHSDRLERSDVDGRMLVANKVFWGGEGRGRNAKSFLVGLSERFLSLASVGGGRGEETPHPVVVPLLENGRKRRGT